MEENQRKPHKVVIDSNDDRKFNDSDQDSSEFDQESPDSQRDKNHCEDQAFEFKCGEAQNPKQPPAIKRTPVHKNGLMLPLNRYQLLSWLYFIFSFLSFILLFLPANLSLSAIYVYLFLSLFLLLSIGVAIFAYLAMKYDPTDRNVKYEKECKVKGIEPKEFLDLNYFCDVCDVFVHDRTKHCGDCNRCCELFDHHCIWLNNCVGAKNYREFILLIVSLFLQTLIQIIVTFSCFLAAIIKPDLVEEGLERVYSEKVNHILIAILAIFFLILNFCVIIFTSSLLLLHIKLYTIDFTAYEYLLYQRDRKERLKELKSGTITQQEFDEEDKLAFADIRKIKRSKIIHEVKRKTRKSVGFGTTKEREIDPKDLKSTSLYYCISAKLCTACTHKVERSRREESIIREQQLRSKITENIEKYTEFTDLKQTATGLNCDNNKKNSENVHERSKTFLKPNKTLCAVNMKDVQFIKIDPWQCQNKKYELTHKETKHNSYPLQIEPEDMMFQTDSHLRISYPLKPEK